MPLSTLSLVENQVRLRIQTDRLMSYGVFWLWVLVLSFLSLGIGASIYAVVIHFQLLNRRSDHFARQHRLFDQVLVGLRELDAATGQQAEKSVSAAEAVLAEMRRYEGRRNPWLWVLLWPMLTFGVAGLWTAYWLTTDWRRHALRQQVLTDHLSAAFRGRGFVSPNIIDEGVPPDRNYWLYLVFTVLTLGLFGIYWGYVIFRDGNAHLASDAFMEDQMLNTLRQAA